MAEQVVAMKFEMIIDEPASVVGHTRFRCEGWLNDDLREHLLHCMECRSILAKDLRDFASQIEIMGPDAIR